MSNIRPLAIDEKRLETLDTVRLGDSIIETNDLLTIFEDTPWHSDLADMAPRYSRFTWFDHEAFLDAFGDDVDPVKHGPYQAATVARPLLLQQQQVEPIGELANELVAYCVIHDFHEGRWGDTPLHIKERDGTDGEFGCWKTMVSEVYGCYANELIRWGEVAENHVLNNIVERVGYVATGLRAWEVLDERQLTNSQQQITLHMAQAVTSYSLTSLERERSNMPYVDAFLAANQQLFSQIAGTLKVDYAAFIEGAGFAKESPNGEQTYAK